MSQPPGAGLPSELRNPTHAFGAPRAVPSQTPGPGFGVLRSEAEVLTLSEERRELFCSVLGLSVKVGLVAVAAISLFRLAGAYQQRMDRQGEIAAVLELEKAQLAKARERFDELFLVDGEQRLIREQSQWIAPDRLRVVWQPSGAGVEPAVVPAIPAPGAAVSQQRKPAALPTVENTPPSAGNGRPRP